MESVTGIGGIFFKCSNPSELRTWYRDHLGVQSEEWGTAFEWREKEKPETVGQTVWNLFPKDAKYFNPSGSTFMINYRVRNLDAMLEQLRAQGVTIDNREDSEYGKFAWVMDPEGNKIELWEPPPQAA